VDTERVLADLVEAVDDFEQTINFYMDDEAWEALEKLTTLADSVRFTLDAMGHR
jgi:uncharacterized membrane protein